MDGFPPQQQQSGQAHDLADGRRPGGVTWATGVNGLLCGLGMRHWLGLSAWTVTEQGRRMSGLLTDSQDTCFTCG